MYWQVLYGTIIYILSFVFNRRYEGKTLTEVCLFVGLSNGIWIVFPAIGIGACVNILRDGNLDIFRWYNECYELSEWGFIGFDLQSHKQMQITYLGYLNKGMNDG
jgi:hypothetical protein